MKLPLALAMLVTACAPAHAGEFNEKPVMCGTLDEAMGAIGVQDQRKMFEGIQITSVLDPDDKLTVFVICLLCYRLLFI